MKTGVLTFHNAFNFGASLQTWALQMALKKMGITPYVIDYCLPMISDLYDPRAKKTGIRKTSLWQRVTRPDSMKRYKRYSAFIHENFQLTGHATSYEELKKVYFDLDACIVGSDQVWNPQHTGGDPAYFLGFLVDQVKKLSYAASIGTDYILPVYYELFRDGLKNLDYISVRESSARGVLKEFTDKDVEVVVDPTLLLDIKEYEDIKRPVHYEEPYILVYMMENSQEIVKLANHISKVLGLPVVQRRSGKYFLNEIKSMYTYTPGEFLSCVENAEFVITNSFHGTVFAILYEKPFISMLHSETGSRTMDLLEMLGLQSHLMREFQTDAWVDKLRFDNKKEVYEKILYNRQQSLDYLKKALAL